MSGFLERLNLWRRSHVLAGEFTPEAIANGMRVIRAAKPARRGRLKWRPAQPRRSR